MQSAGNPSKTLTQYAIAGRIGQTAAPLEGVTIERIEPGWRLGKYQAVRYGGMYKICDPSGRLTFAFGDEILIG